MNYVNGQDYHAIAGSNYAGALGVHNNPAAIVNTPYPWDITLIGIQAKYQTNAITVIDYSLLSSPANSKFLINGGDFSRYGNSQANINLLNARLSVSRKKSVAFGVNLKSISNIKTDPYNYRDTIQDINAFLSMNTGSGPLAGQLRSNNLLEFYGTYSQTILDHPNYRLNGGLTIKVNKGLAGVSANVNNIKFQETVINGETGYLINSGDITYGYASNMDPWENNQGGSNKLRSLLQGARFGFSVDAGLELIIKPAGVPGYMDDEESYYDYDWKIGASLVDVGRGQYRYGENSYRGTVPSQGIPANILDAKFDSTITGLSEFSDSLATIMTLNSLGGNLNIYTPARIILNADRYISGGFFINGELSINITSLLGKKRIVVQDMNLLRVTPRWETRRWGLYLPMQVNTKGQFWLGAAGKAGPLLIGFHNLGNVFGKNKMANGGGFVALTIRPGERVTRGKKQKMLDCPPY
jgi:hypothetical protein